MAIIERVDVTWCGKPAGRACVAIHDDGCCYVWERPDGVAEYRSYEHPREATVGLVDRVAQWYGGLQ